MLKGTHTAQICMTVLLSYFLITLAEFIWKRSLLVISEILELLVNMFTTDGKYSLRNRQKLPPPIQILLCNF